MPSTYSHDGHHGYSSHYAANDAIDNAAVEDQSQGMTINIDGPIILSKSKDIASLVQEAYQVEQDPSLMSL